MSLGASNHGEYEGDQPEDSATAPEDEAGEAHLTSERLGKDDRLVVLGCPSSYDDHRLLLLLVMPWRRPLRGQRVRGVVRRLSRGAELWGGVRLSRHVTVSIGVAVLPTRMHRWHLTLWYLTVGHLTVGHLTAGHLTRGVRAIWGTGVVSKSLEWAVTGQW